MKLFEEIEIRYVNRELNIGLQDVRNVWLLSPEPIKFITCLHQGNLSYRLPGSANRTSYRQLKKGLIKKHIVIRQPQFVLPF